MLIERSHDANVVAELRQRPRSSRALPYLESSGAWHPACNLAVTCESTRGCGDAVARPIHAAAESASEPSPNPGPVPEPIPEPTPCRRRRPLQAPARSRAMVAASGMPMVYVVPDIEGNRIDSDALLRMVTPPDWARHAPRARRAASCDRGRCSRHATEVRVAGFRRLLRRHPVRALQKHHPRQLHRFRCSRRWLQLRL